jgi:hypothetical protein
MDYLVSQERMELLIKGFSTFDFDEDAMYAQADLFASITNPIELYIIAFYHNWDLGTELLSLIINCDECDKGTAMMIFWAAEPGFYTQFSNEQEAEWASDVYNLLQEIMYNWENGFYQEQIVSYDPRRNQTEQSSINYHHPEEKWQIPDYLKQPIVGKVRVYYSQEECRLIVKDINNNG